MPSEKVVFLFKMDYFENNLEDYENDCYIDQ